MTIYGSWDTDARIEPSWLNEICQKYLESPSISLDLVNY